ncbi:MAG: long-chain fatty acid--CoA ligase [Vulcanimicrobiota bacterium]
MYLNRWLPNHASFRPDHTALICADTDKRLSYAELYGETLAVCQALKRQGVGKGDRVALFAQNDLRFFPLFFAAARLGAITVPLNWRLSPAELEGILADCDPKVMYVDGRFPPEAVPHHENTVHLDCLFKESACEEDVPAVDLPEDAPVAIFYTGGTTGTPKGAILTHKSIHWNAVNTTCGWSLSPDDIAPVFTPLFHTGGLNVFATPMLMLGGTTILSRSFDPEQALNLIEKERCTILFLVPTMYHMVKESPTFNPDKLRRLKIMISGGAPCPRPLFEAYWSHGLPLRQGYGLTEAGPNNFGIEQKQAEARVTTVGKPLAFVDLDLFTEDGKRAAVGEVGEIRIKGPHVMAGYWNRSQATAEVFADGWLRTGDLAVKDQDGYFTICGRQKDMFISGGENVFPSEIEEVLLAHPLVAEAAVVGIANDKWGEVGRAHLVVREGPPSDFSDDLKKFCRERLAGYKIPKEFRVEQALPKSAAGKVLKQELVLR